jgi:hypothetical protein
MVIVLVQQWEEIEAALPAGWATARLRISFADETTAVRATALLGPLGPGRSGADVRLGVTRSGEGVGPAGLVRALRRLDAARLRGTLELVAVEEAEPERAPVEPAGAAAAAAASLAESWDALVATLPPDWSDLYVEVGLRSSDYLARASLNMTPLNPRRAVGRAALTFRAARRFGYGAAPSMVRRCLERCDRDSIRGDLRLLRVLSDTSPVATQGPVWHIGGRTV